MNNENERQVTQTNPNLVKRFHVLLNRVYIVMPNSFKKKVKKSEFYDYIREAYDPDARVRNMNRSQFLVFVHLFTQFTYANILGFYYDIDLLINLVGEIQSEFKPFLTLCIDEYKRQE